METEKLFSAGMRVIGLLSAGRGIGDLLYAAMDSLQLTTRSVTDTSVSYTEFVYGVFYLLLGLYLIRGAPWVMGFAFPNRGSGIADLIDRDERQDPTNSSDS